MSAQEGPRDNSWLIENVINDVIRIIHGHVGGQKSGEEILRVLTEGTPFFQDPPEQIAHAATLIAQIMIDHNIIITTNTHTTDDDQAPSRPFVPSSSIQYKLHPAIVDQLQHSSSAAALDLRLSFDLDRPPKPGEIRTEEQYLKHLLCFRLAWNNERQRLLRLLQSQKEEFENNANIGAEVVSKDDQPKKAKKIRRTWESLAEAEFKATLSKHELERQEVIFEMFSTEAGYIKDLQSIQKLMQEIEANCPMQDKPGFMTKVFANFEEIMEVNSKMQRRFKERQNKNKNLFVDVVSDILTEHVSSFVAPYSRYCSNRMISRVTLEKELSNNKRFKEICDEQQSKDPRWRKLSLEDFLTLPVTRFPRYSLFLKDIKKLTDNSHPEKQALEKTLVLLSEAAQTIDTAAGVANNAFKLQELMENYLKQNEKGTVAKKIQTLDLLNPQRQLIRSGLVDAKNEGAYAWAQVKLVVFDHMVIVTSPHDKILPWTNMPIAMNLLDIMEDEDKAEVEPKANRFQSFRSSLKKEKDDAPDGEFSTSSSSLKLSSVAGSIRKKRSADDSSADSRPRRGSMDSVHGGNSKSKTFVIQHLGKTFFSFKASTVMEKEAWVKCIQDAQAAYLLKEKIFEEVTILPRAPERFTCSIGFSDPETGKKAFLFGANTGIYLATTADESFSFVHIVSVENVTQLDIRLDYGVIFALAGDPSSLLIFSLKVLTNKKAVAADPGSRVDGTKGTIIFLLGALLGRNTVCCLRSKFGGYQCVVVEIKRSKKSAVETMKSKTFMLGIKDRPQSLRMDLQPGKITICGEYSMYNVDVPNEKSTQFLHPDNKYPTPKPRTPLRMFKIEQDVLVCFQECAFFVKTWDGSRTNEETIIFTGKPTSFALSYPYLLAFCDRFVEIHHIFTGDLKQVVILNDLGHISLNSDSDPTAPIICCKSLEAHRASTYAGSSVVALQLPKKASAMSPKSSTDVPTSEPVQRPTSPDPSPDSKSPSSRSSSRDTLSKPKRKKSNADELAREDSEDSPGKVERRKSKLGSKSSNPTPELVQPPQESLSPEKPLQPFTLEKLDEEERAVESAKQLSLVEVEGKQEPSPPIPEGNQATSQEPAQEPVSEENKLEVHAPEVTSEALSPPPSQEQVPEESGKSEEVEEQQQEQPPIEENADAPKSFQPPVIIKINDEENEMESEEEELEEELEEEEEQGDEAEEEGDEDENVNDPSLTSLASYEVGASDSGALTDPPLTPTSRAETERDSDEE